MVKGEYYQVKNMRFDEDGNLKGVEFASFGSGTTMTRAEILNFGYRWMLVYETEEGEDETG